MKVSDELIKELEWYLNRRRTGILTAEIDSKRYGKINIIVDGNGYFKDMDSVGCRIEDEVEFPITSSGVNCENALRLLTGKIMAKKSIVIEGPPQDPERYRAFLVSNSPTRSMPDALKEAAI